MKEWPEETYPPWAHGPGYVISRDIAKAVVKMNKEGRLKVLNTSDTICNIVYAKLFHVPTVPHFGQWLFSSLTVMFFSLQMFKLEDVAMGIWIADMKKEGLKVRYENEVRIYNEGCKDGYVVAHYQGPREMLCLWQKLQEGEGITYHPRCCGQR